MLVNRNEKLNILRQEFAELNVNHDDFITHDELLEFLDQKLKKEFDRNVAYQLFERMDKDSDGKVTVDEFIRVFMEAEDVLDNKIQNSKKYLEDYHKQRKEAIKKLEEIRNTERLNAYGIMEGSVLNITIMEAQNLQKAEWGSSTDGFCVLICGDTKYQTGVQRGKNPVWNENFSFPIDTGMETLQIQMMDYDAFSRNDFLGQVVISLEQLRDQTKHDDWFDIIDRNHNSTGASVHLTVQWIHSRVKYLNDVVHKWDEHICMQEEDLQDYEKDIMSIYEPFPRLLKVMRGDKYSAKPTHKADDRGNAKKPETPYVLPRDPNYVMEPGKSFDLEGMNIVKLIENPKIKSAILEKLPLILTVALLTFSVFICFNRAVYLEISIGMFYLIHFLLGKIDFKTMKFFAGATVFSFILDLPWLVIYTKRWWVSDQVFPYVEQSLRQFVIVFSYFLFFLKIAVALAYFKESIKLSKDQEQINQSNQVGQEAGYY